MKNIWNTIIYCVDTGSDIEPLVQDVIDKAGLKRELITDTITYMIAAGALTRDHTGWIKANRKFEDNDEQTSTN